MIIFKCVLNRGNFNIFLNTSLYIVHQWYHKKCVLLLLKMTAIMGAYNISNMVFCEILVVEKNAFQLTLILLSHFL